MLFDRIERYLCTSSFCKKQKQKKKRIKFFAGNNIFRKTSFVRVAIIFKSTKWKLNSLFKLYRYNIITVIFVVIRILFNIICYYFQCIEAGFFCLTVIDDVLQRRSDSGKSPLKGFLDYMYTSIIFPVSMVITLCRFFFIF